MAKLLEEIEALQRDIGLSDHRVGIILANNGRLLERLRAGRRIWPDTERSIRSKIRAVRRERACVQSKHLAAGTSFQEVDRQ